MGIIHPAGFMGARNSACINLVRASSQYAKIPDVDQTGLELRVDDFTVEALVNFSSLPGTAEIRTIASKYNPISSDGWRFSLNEGFGPYYLVLAIDNTFRSVSWTPSTDTWHHVAVVSRQVFTDRSTGFYVDGSLQGSLQTDSWALPTDISADFTLGANPLGNDCFDGMVDEFRVWVTNRTSTQLNDNKHQIIQTAPYLICSSHLDYSLKDSSGSANHMTAVNSPTYVANDLPFAA